MERVLTKPWFFEARRIAPFVGRGIDVDVVLDLMIHDIDIIAHLVGRPVKRVEAVGIPVMTSSIDIANARISFEGGATANVTASRAAFKSERTIRIFQPDVYISLDFGAKKLKMYSKTGGSDDKGFPKIKTEEHKVLERDALRDEIDAFIQCVEHRTPPEVSGYDGLKAIELADRIHDAFRASADALDADEETLRAMVNASC
jgi:predicted dehydrogenase